MTIALYGLYHRGVARGENRLAWTQVACAAVGTPVMTANLAAYLATGTEFTGFIVVAVLSSFLVFAGMALFLAVIVADRRSFGANLAPRTA